MAYEREKAEAEELAKMGAPYEMEDDALRCVQWGGGGGIGP